MILGSSKKRQRVGSSTRLSDETLPENPRSHLLRPNPGGFNDPITADVVLNLQPESSPFESDPTYFSDAVEIYLHSNVLLSRSKYFAALLSDRWQGTNNSDKLFRLSLKIPATGSIEAYITVLQLFYSDDFTETIVSASIALSLLPVTLELLFDDCIRACIRFLESVPWSEEEEKGVLNIVQFLKKDESQELLARVLPANLDSSEEMLHGLILAAIHSHPHSATVKAFVAKLLRDHSSRDSVRRVLDRAFETSLRSVKDLMEEYSSPSVRGNHDETEAMQRLNLHTAGVNGRHLLWLVERMIELRVADKAVSEWSNQASFAADLQRAFRDDDAWRNIAPGLPALMLRCTCRLANAVAAGSILADREVRMKLVKDWLPVLIVCRDTISPIPSSQKLLYQELEVTFLQIISTLPMLDAQKLLQQCLSFSTRNVEDCPHLISAFNTWFRRATRPPSIEGDN